MPSKKPNRPTDPSESTEPSEDVESTQMFENTRLELESLEMLLRERKSGNPPGKDPDNADVKSST